MKISELERIDQFIKFCNVYDLDINSFHNHKNIIYSPQNTIYFIKSEHIESLRFDDGSNFLEKLDSCCKTTLYLSRVFKAELTQVYYEEFYSEKYIKLDFNSIERFELLE